MHDLTLTFFFIDKLTFIFLIGLCERLEVLTVLYKCVTRHLKLN